MPDERSETESREKRMEDCTTCRLNAGFEHSPGGPIFDDGIWRLEHIIQPPVVGWLVLKPMRHVEALAKLSDVEAQELGPLLRDVAAAITDAIGPEKVYLSMFMEAPGFEHLHIHIIPRAANVPDDRRGPRIFEYLRSNEADPAWRQAATEISRELGRVLGSTSGGDGERS